MAKSCAGIAGQTDGRAATALVSRYVPLVPAGGSDEWGGAGVSEKPNGVRADRHVRHGHTSRPNNAAKSARVWRSDRGGYVDVTEENSIRASVVVTTSGREMGKGRARSVACAAYVTAVGRPMADHVRNTEWMGEKKNQSHT